MANISVLSRLINGVQRNVDLSANTLVVNTLKVVSTDLTQTILDNLVSLQDGSDFSDGTGAHTHDGRYFTETEVSDATGGSSGSMLVGDDDSYSSFTPVAATVKGALSGIDSALGAVSANSSFSDTAFNVYNNSDPSKKIMLDASAISTTQTKMLKMADANVDLANLTNSNISASAAIAYSKLNLSVSIVDGDISPSADISYNKLDLTNSIVNADVSSSAAIAYSKLNLAGSVTAADQNSGVATSVQALFSNGGAGATYRSIVSGDLPDLSSIYVNVSQKASPNGVATLDGSGKVPVVQLPNAVMEFQGAWDPSTNSPALVDGSGNTGDVYRVSVQFAGPIGGLTEPSMVDFQVGDFVIYSGTLNKWQRSPAADGVTSVNGMQGAVTVNAIYELTGDVTAGPATASQSQVATIANNAITAAKINTSAVDGVTVTGGGGSTLSVIASPRGVKNVIAGESMAANTSFLVRYAMNGETAGRVYKADQDATSLDKFYAVGVALKTSTVNIGDTVSATYEGTHILGSSDTPFSPTDIGKPVYLTASGAFSVTPPSTALYAVWRIGIVENTDRIWVSTLQLNGIN